MSIQYNIFGDKKYIQQKFQGKPIIRYIVPPDFPALKIYKIVEKINHPNIVKIYKIHKLNNNIAIDMEYFLPMIQEYEGPEYFHIFNKKELKEIQDAVNELNKNNIIIVKLTREHLGFDSNHKVKFINFLDSGIQSQNNPYKWYLKPKNFEYNKKRLRRCDFYSYLSGVYKLKELDTCAFQLFQKANTNRRKLIHWLNIECSDVRPAAA